MKSLKRFFGQPIKSYRNFQIIFFLLTLNFVIPALSYAMTPDLAINQFSKLSQLLGSGEYSQPETQTRMWRHLAAANVMTLGVMCFLMMLNLRKYRLILFPLAFLKAFNASLFFLDYLAYDNRAFLAVAVFDFFTTWLFVHFSKKAYTDIQGIEDSLLVPRPFD